MKLYYYEYETTVFLPFSNPSYDLVQGFLLETPYGFLQMYDEDESNMWPSAEDFNNHVKKFYPQNFQMVELK